MNAEELNKIGIPFGKPLQATFDAIKKMSAAGLERLAMEAKLAAAVAQPSAYLADEVMGDLAQLLENVRYAPRTEPVPWQIWGETLIEDGARQQMSVAAMLPVSVAGALMPDAHVGYGLPIGGVLATRNAVIPYAVGVDIACRMKLTVLDIPPAMLDGDDSRLRSALGRETKFGVGEGFQGERRYQHPVLDRDWNVSPITTQYRDKAWSQLGTSGSGNHFVEFGTLTLDTPALGLEAGVYLSLLSHSGSRGTGAAVANYYSNLALKIHPELPREQSRLAWLDLDQEEGREYWAAMELMGEYAAANHACIHTAIAKNLGAQVMLDIENHHNFAWRETHNGEEVIVHRKGATPAGKGVLGLIPGSMATPGYVVRGLGNANSLNSCSHGAGRCISRTAAFKTLKWQDTLAQLAEKNIKLISAGLDESPQSYKNIQAVMSAQSDLVEILARFDPRLVKMAPSGERPED